MSWEAGLQRAKWPFITIDPERDSPQALKEYLKAFQIRKIYRTYW